MAKIGDLTIAEFDNLIEQKVLEMLGDPDYGLELKEEFKKKAEERLKKNLKRYSHKEVKKRFG
jgi:hypothetical protein